MKSASILLISLFIKYIIIDSKNIKIQIRGD